MSKVWFLTGCSTGFGHALCQKLLDRGDRVVATARRLSDLDDLHAKDADNLLRIELDVTRGAQIDAAAAKTIRKFGYVDVLVNNAGYGYFAMQEDGDVDEIRRMFETNVVGLIRTTQAFLPQMRERRNGTIVNLSSIAGRVTFPRAGFYNATKWAVEAVSEALYLETATFGLRVIVIEPGAYATDFASRSAVRDPGLANPDSPYADLAQKWTDAAAKMMPDRQDPNDVVDGIIKAVDDTPPFARLPFGKDATSLIRERESTSDEEFVRIMSTRYGNPQVRFR